VARVLITGAAGFVGRWLTQELIGAGHQVVALDLPIDVRDAQQVSRAFADCRPDAVAHLAAISFLPDAAADAQAAFAVAIAGTANVMEAARTANPPPPVLVTGSSEAYGPPSPGELPLTEASPLRAAGPYGLSKLAQESVAIAYARRYGLRVVATRSFNHTGPGQRSEFVVPALARRVYELAQGRVDRVPVGNLDVLRDVSDVRDVVRAYRLLLTACLERDYGRGGIAVNVCSGESVSIRWIADELCRLAGVEPRLTVDEALVRKDDPPEIRGDFSLLANTTGWRPERALTETLRDVWASTSENVGPLIDR
jgi:GDP-4-dehydro-6-deoxy-D-mannose reductase